MCVFWKRKIQDPKKHFLYKNRVTETYESNATECISCFRKLKYSMTVKMLGHMGLQLICFSEHGSDSFKAGLGLTGHFQP